MAALLGHTSESQWLRFARARLRHLFLRLNGLINRIEGTNTYLPTAEGQRVAIFYTKIYNRLLRPLLAANDPPAPLHLRTALRAIDRHVHDYIDHARLGNAA